MVNIAIMGYGIVGSGVAELIQKNYDKIEHASALPMRVKYILDLRDFPESPFADKMIKDFTIIEHDPEVQVVVECIGGAKAAYEFTKRCLLAGKSVVTSNKELVAEHGVELLRLAQTNNLNYLFEASVGGGIPIIRPINQCLAANRITEICGILNGTSNFVLTSMQNSGQGFEKALAEAQRLGYAEADPADDINGSDACRKICILSSLSFGRHIYPRQVYTEGITEITAQDMAFANENGYRIKLLGRALDAGNGKFVVLVAPHMIPLDNPLSQVDDVYNGILVRGDAIGDVMFYGRGAGKLPTASAVVADIIDAAKHFTSRKYVDWDEGGDDLVLPPYTIEYKWYVNPENTHKIRIL